MRAGTWPLTCREGVTSIYAPQKGQEGEKYLQSLIAELLPGRVMGRRP